MFVLNLVKNLDATLKTALQNDKFGLLFEELPNQQYGNTEILFVGNQEDEMQRSSSLEIIWERARNKCK